jgi:hypothetical protein
MQSKTEEFRAKAAHCRRQAAEALPEFRDEFAKLAEKWCALADAEEANVGRSSLEGPPGE